MNNLTRKQREIFEREQLILDAAQHIMKHEGYHSLTMEHVAAEVEYSKGTIYNHFASKEEIVCGIICRCMGTLVSLFERAAAWTGSHRERIAAIGIAHALHAQLNASETENFQLIKSQAVREKISAQKQEDIHQLEQRVTSIVMDVIRDAMRDGELPASETYAPDGAFFGLWSMGYGANLLYQTDIPFESLGMRHPLDLMWVNSNKLLDSYQWKPLSSEFDIFELRDRLTKTLFADEYPQLQEMNTSPSGE